MAARSVARSIGYIFAMISLRLSCSTCRVEVRLLEINGRWIASADTLSGPSLGLAKGAIEADNHAHEPIEPLDDELMASLPLAGIR